MNMVSIIEKKKQGHPLSHEEISFLVHGYTEDKIPDYQVASLMMAIWCKGMNKDEVHFLTKEMSISGDVVDLSGIKGIKVDKHSTGGVGDKTSMIVGPMVASLGVKVAKLSGRGLGFTGGTIDKLESIPGFMTSIPDEKFFELVNTIGLSIIGQTAHIAPADKKFYALRDVTATIDSIPLIAASIMSKKLAAGSDAIVLDVKCGEGAFMEDLDQAIKLAELMVEIGREAGKETVALITDMSQPLGTCVGNSNEVLEAIDTLKGKGPEDLTDLSLSLAGMMLKLAGKAKSLEEGYGLAEETINNGSALKKFKEFVKGQGGDENVVEKPELLPQAHEITEIKNHLIDGYVKNIHARTIGQASQFTGAGRTVKEEEIDLSAGIKLLKKKGDKCKKGETFALVYGRDKERVKEGVKEAEKAFIISSSPPKKAPLIFKIVE